VVHFLNKRWGRRGGYLWEDLEGEEMTHEWSEGHIAGPFRSERRGE
jgi:hypothetical protein